MVWYAWLYSCCVTKGVEYGESVFDHRWDIMYIDCIHSVADLEGLICDGEVV